MESFLRRYLAIFEGTLREMDQRSQHRDSLLDPHAAPAEVLPWLAGFLGLEVDERWPESVLRQLIAQAAWLFRFRGTVAGLQRFLEIYLGIPVIILEKFRLRGIGGRILGDDSSPLTRPVLGAGFRVGGAIGTGTGDAAEAPLQGSLQDVYASTAHRFSVLIPGSPSVEQLSVVQRILDVHRPAHTVVDVCTAGSGIRVGHGLLVGISSIIGPTGGFDPVVLDDVVLGRASVLGRPGDGVSLGTFSLGSGTGIE